MRTDVRPFAALLMPVLLYSAGPDAVSPLVNLSIIALDNKGHAVTDLTAADFEVKDAGQRRDISFFRPITSRLADPPALAAGEVGNRRPGVVHHPTVLLFDLLNARFSNRTLVVNQIVQQLTGLETADDLYMYLLTPDGHLFAVHALPGAVSENTRPVGKPWTADLKPILDEALKGISRIRKFDYDTSVRIQLTLNSLQEVANLLAAFPGRKNIVWLTDGIPVYAGTPRYIAGEPLDFTGQLRPFSEIFALSGTSIYSVPQMISGNEDFDALSELTGGLPSGKKDIAATVTQAIADTHTSYQLAFRPPPASLDKTFHKLRIVCTRKGVRIVSKTGYYAFPEQPGVRAIGAIRAVVNTPSDAAGIGLRGSVALDTAGRTGHLSVHIDTGDLVLTEQGDKHLGQVRLALVLVMADGRNVTSPIVPIDLHLTTAQREVAAKQGVPFDQEIVLMPGLKAVRVAAFDQAAEAVSSLTIPMPERP